MTSPRDSMEVVAKTIAESGELPDEMSLILEEADEDSQHANVDLPLLEILPTEVENVVTNNTDLVGFVTDDAGNRVGRLYESEYEMGIEINIWTEAEGRYDPDDLGEKLRDALYPHSSYGPQQEFTDADGNVVDDINYFRLDTGERVDDLLNTPTTRVWSQDVELWGVENFSTTEEYITDVSYPEDGDFNDTDDDGVIDSVQ